MGLKTIIMEDDQLYFIWDNDRWHAIHLHVSEPSAHLAAGESFPVESFKGTK